MLMSWEGCVVEELGCWVLMKRCNGIKNARGVCARDRVFSCARGWRSSRLP